MTVMVVAEEISGLIAVTLRGVPAPVPDRCASADARTSRQRQRRRGPGYGNQE
jgi:hypothetical protein